MNLYRLLLFVTLAVHVSSTDIHPPPGTKSHPQLDENPSNGANGPGSSVPRSESASSEPPALNSRRVTSSLDRRHPGNLVALEDGGRLDTQLTWHSVWRNRARLRYLANDIVATPLHNLQVRLARSQNTFQPRLGTHWLIISNLFFHRTYTHIQLDETKTMNLYRLLLFVTLAVHVSSTDIHVPSVTDSHTQLLDEKPSNGAEGPGSSVLHSESTSSGTPALSSHRGTSNVQNPNDLDVEQGLGNPVAPRPSRVRQSYGRRCAQFVVRHQRAITLAGWCYIIGKPIIKNLLNGAGAKRRSLDEEGNLDLVSEGNGAQRMERRGPGSKEEGQEYEILPEQCDCQSATEYMDEDGKLHPIPEGSSHGGTEEHTKREVFKSIYRRRLEDDDGME